MLRIYLPLTYSMALSLHHQPYLKRLLFEKSGKNTRADFLLATLLLLIISSIGLFLIIGIAAIGVELGWYDALETEGPMMSGIIIAMLFFFAAWIFRIIAMCIPIRKRLRDMDRSPRSIWRWYGGLLFIPLHFIFFIVLSVIPATSSLPENSV